MYRLSLGKLPSIANRNSQFPDISASIPDKKDLHAHAATEAFSIIEPNTYIEPTDNKLYSEGDSLDVDTLGFLSTPDGACLDY